MLSTLLTYRIKDIPGDHTIALSELLNTLCVDSLHNFATNYVITLLVH